MYENVRLFRKAMLKVQSRGFKFPVLNDFPLGCCEFTSYLLAKYMIDEFKLPVRMVRGENIYKLSQRHVWLRVGSMDIDITANQFSSTNKTMFFESYSLWHQRYSIYDTETPDSSFNQFHDEPKRELLHDYKNILKVLKDLKR